MTLRAHFQVVGESVAITLVRHGEHGNAALELLPVPAWVPVVPDAEVRPTLLLPPADSESVLRVLGYLEHVAAETP